MGKSSIKYIDTAYMYNKRTAVKPVTNPVVYGRFPDFSHRKSSIEKINNFLSGVLLILVLFSLVSYYFVSDSEKNMNKLGREIVALSNENIELQNKLDNLHSFNRVEAVIHNNTNLDTAKKVIEIPAVNMAAAPKIQPVKVSYNWSMGY